MDPSDPTNLVFRAFTSENGNNNGFNTSPGWNATNFTGVTGDVTNTKFYFSTIPTPMTGPSSTFTNTFVVNGVSYPFVIADLIKTDDTTTLTFGQITVTFPDSTEPSATEKSNITNHLLSIFSKVDAGVFGAEGIPNNVVGGSSGKDESAGFAVAPNNRPSGVTTNLLSSNTPTASSFNKRDFGASSSRYLQAEVARKNINSGVNFSFNLKNLLANQRQREALQYTGNGHDIPAPTSQWNLWASGKYTDITTNSSTADRGGHLWTSMAGVSYAVNKIITVGGFGRMRFGKVSSKMFDSKLASDFYGAGGFISSQFKDGLHLRLAGLYEHGNNKINIAGATGSFKSDQYSIEGDIGRRFTSDSGIYWIEPSVNVRYSELYRKGFTDSVGTQVGRSTIKLGRLKFGPLMGATHKRPEATYKPFVRINGVWDFVHEDGFTTASTTTFDVFGNQIITPGQKISPPRYAFYLGTGVEVLLKNGIALKVAGDWLNFSRGLEAVSLSGSIGVPFDVFGGDDSPVSAGMVSLGFAGNATAASTKLKVSIPFNGKAK